MTKPAAVLGSPHVCPRVNPGEKPHVGGPVVSPGQSSVRIDGLAVAVVSGECFCSGVSTTDSHTTGSARIKIDGKRVMRVGDTTAHGGKIVAGMPNLKFC
ncbi:PAAR domain-containing protein [Marivita sp. S0852]|uniref:PAAR domain-containing protein n=1 Tax=Marivita sp. S0852 TaxID=3373893 RepID=UPI003982C713